ncbi:Hypothetical predicted protein [Mytilus galloprovincialis]|uniref:Peptidase S1 domain-containing protein n=1 Tax=Mytilus galloprovincialis TaxID=29158 RepID=A0A8B6GP96_MYTGA|nr:Hypothetical predicted protein [Mytilus galloprovincialis]
MMQTVVLLLCVVVIGNAEVLQIWQPGKDLMNEDNLKHLTNTSRIIQGQDADIADFPWQVSLRTSSDSHTCGGIILTDTWILTAAHCTQGSGYTIRVGDTNRNNGERYQVRRVINHANYNDGSGTISNDISLIELSSSLSFGSTVAPISLPPAGQLFESASCVITGWGRTCGTCGLPTILQKLNTLALRNTECANYMRPISGVNLLSSHICVHNQNSNPQDGACNGDSGGPMTCTVSGQTYVAGVTSWVISSQSTGCLPDYPSVYTRVTSFLSWIRLYVPGV